MLGWTNAKANSCTDKLIIVHPSEIEKFQKAGLVAVDDANSIGIDQKLIDSLTKKGRIKTVNAAASTNCDGNLTDAPKK